MKKVVKVSIGNLAFTIDEDGYELLKAYLGELNAHYRSKQNGDEIIEGIEERMAELFLEKSGKDSVVSMEVVKDVINILGRPEIIDEETGTSEFETNQEKGTRLTPKRLYRDPDHKVLGGVCSGLATYLNLDRILVRIIFFLLFLGFSSVGFHHGSGSLIVLMYIVLWIVIPEARTVEQRCAMHGESPDLSHIQKRVEDGANQVGSGLRRVGSQGGAIVNSIFSVILKVIAVFLVIFSVSGILFLSFLLLGAEIFQGVIPFDIFDYVQIGFQNPIWLKVSFLLVMFLPLVGMLYGGIQILFGFKSPRLRPGLIIFILWIISGIVFTILVTKASRPYWNERREISEVPMLSKSDTIYIKFSSVTTMPKSRVLMEGDEYGLTLFWVDDAGKERKFVAFPKVRIVRQSEEEGRLLSLRTQAFSYTGGDAMVKAQNNPPVYELTDSLLTIHSDVYDKTNKWDGTNKTISLYIPEGVKVIVQEPLKFGFDAHMRIHEKWDWYWDNH